MSMPLEPRRSELAPASLGSLIPAVLEAHRRLGKELALTQQRMTHLHDQLQSAQSDASRARQLEAENNSLKQELAHVGGGKQHAVNDEDQGVLELAYEEIASLEGRIRLLREANDNLVLELLALQESADDRERDQASADALRLQQDLMTERTGAQQLRVEVEHALARISVLEIQLGDARRQASEARRQIERQDTTIRVLRTATTTCSEDEQSEGYTSITISDPIPAYRFLAERGINIMPETALQPTRSPEQPIPLANVLQLVGRLDDTLNSDSPRRRFREYLADHVRDMDHVSEYIDHCMNAQTEQTDRALQDIVNHVGRLIGFTVEFGPYGQSGDQCCFDGIWNGADLAIALEIVPGDVLPVSPGEFLQHIDSYSAKNQVNSSRPSLGVYVFGEGSRQEAALQKAILESAGPHRLRSIHVDSLLSMAALRACATLSHQQILALLQPRPVSVDESLALIIEVLTGPRSIPSLQEQGGADNDQQGTAPASERRYLLTPVRNRPGKPATDTIRDYLNKGYYVFAADTPFRAALRPGDKICFYASKVGVVASADITSQAELRPRAEIPEEYPWVFSLANPHDFLDRPVVLTADLCAKLDACKKKGSANWNWIVSFTKNLTAHDFRMLTESTVTQAQSPSAEAPPVAGATADISDIQPLPTIYVNLANGIQTAPAEQSRHGLGFWLKDEFYPAQTARDMLCQVFELFAARDDSFLERFASLPQGRTRRYLARQPEELYPGRPDLAKSFSKQLQSGWWIGTNNSRISTAKIIETASQAAGLEYGVELIVQLGD